MNKIDVQWLQNYLMAARDLNDEMTHMDNNFPRADRIECADGFSLSVQASHGHYCHPRRNVAGWSQVEVGYPSQPPANFKDYAEDHDRLTETVYGYVPIELVVDEINSHGGVQVSP